MTGYGIIGYTLVISEFCLPRTILDPSSSFLGSTVVSWAVGRAHRVLRSVSNLAVDSLRLSRWPGTGL